MDNATRQRAHELERQARTVHPASAINQLCVMVARLEAEVAKLRETLAAPTGATTSGPRARRVTRSLAARS